MRVLLVLLGLLLYLGVIYLWIKSDSGPIQWVLMFALVILPSLLYYFVRVRLRNLARLNKYKLPDDDFIYGQTHLVNKPSELSADDAYRILDIPNSSNEEAIVEAHRQLMVRNHPDRGGSPYIATLINQAKTKLMEQQYD
jgi:hypothetical protein